MDEQESLYGVPSHLKTSSSIGAIPERTFYVITAALVIGSLPAYVMFQNQQPVGTLTFPILLRALLLAFLIGMIPVLLLSPFGISVLDPPAEHGMMRWLAYHLGRKNYHTQHLKSLKDVRIEDGVIYTRDGVRAIIALASLNLDLASTGSKRRHRAKLGKLLDGLSTHQFQFVIRTRMQSKCTAIERMRMNKNPFSRKLADWLSDHYENNRAIDRRRYMIVPGDNVETLKDRLETITRSLSQANLDAEVLTDELDIREVVNGWWTWRPHPERLGPELVHCSATNLQIDGEFVAVYSMSKLPSSITTNWWYALVDGDLPIDVVMTCEQQDLGLAKWRLDARANNLGSSHLSAGRSIALAQVHELRRAFETKVKPWNMQCLFVVRGHDQATLKQHAGRLAQQMKDLGGTLHLLRWEQIEGIQSAQPLCTPMMPHRMMYLESGTLARTTPFSASTLQMLDGVPWGLSGSTPILLTTQHMRTGKHFGWFGFTGSGKGFGLRCYLARRHFADRLRIFMWDGDNATHEYAGRFTTFLRGVSIPLSTIQNVKDLEIDPVWQVVAFDVSMMPDPLRPQAFAIIKDKVEKHVLEFPGETALVVDEATSLAEHPDQSGARALGEAVTTWRKYGVECHIITQRVSDWFGTAIGRKIQGNLSVKWYGSQEDSELSEIAKRVNWSPEELERVGGAGTGQGLLVAFGRRVWADLYQHCSPDEYAAYMTDPAERVEVLAQRPVEITTNGVVHA